MTDYSKYVLTDSEKLAFSKFELSDTAMLDYEAFKILKAKGLVTKSFDGKDPWFQSIDKSAPGRVNLSQSGKEYRAYLQSLIPREAPAYSNLSPNDNKVLVYVIKHLTITSDQIYNKFGDPGNARFESFVSSKLLVPANTMTDKNGNTVPGNKYKVSDIGKAYMQEYRINRILYWLPIIIDAFLSITAIIISIISLLK